MYASLHASLHRQAKALELLCRLLEEEYGILLSRRADDVAGLEFSIQELIRQLAVEKVTVITAMNGVRVTDYAAELCAAPGREAEGVALHEGRAARFAAGFAQQPAGPGPAGPEQPQPAGPDPSGSARTGGYLRP